MGSQTQFGTGAIKAKSILKAAGVAVLAAFFCVGCGDNGVSNGKGSEPTRKEEKIATQLYNSSGSYSFTFNNAGPNSPAEIEVYAIGGGGGGQGGAYNTGLSPFEGTGGAGGGGAAVYMKLSVTTPVSFSVVVGSGGSGGKYTGGGLLDGAESGSPGGSGGETSVSWSSQTIKITAEGGAGGGGSGTLVTGGTGGRTRPADLPTGNRYYIDGTTAGGGNGNAGVLKSNVANDGGKAAVINKGSEAPFGGGNGARRTTSGVVTPAQSGGGGSGGYDNNNGSSGGSGLVYIIVKYYE